MTAERWQLSCNLLLALCKIAFSHGNFFHSQYENAAE
jgi:hypothetical protein